MNGPGSWRRSVRRTAARCGACSAVRPLQAIGYPANGISRTRRMTDGRGIGPAVSAQREAGRVATRMTRAAAAQLDLKDKTMEDNWSALHNAARP